MNNALEVYNGAGEQGRQLVIDDRYDAQDEDSDQLDLRALTNALRRRRTLLISVFVGVMLLTVLIMLILTPQYTASTQVVIDVRQTQLTPPNEQVLTSQGSETSTVVDTEVEVIESSEMAEAVDAAQHLDTSPYYAPVQASGPIATVRALFFGRKIDPRTYDKAAQHTYVINALKKNLTVTRQGSTYALEIDFTSPDPAFSQRIANEYARQYAQAQTDQKTAATQKAQKFLRDRLGQLASQADADTGAVQEYRIRHNLLSSNAQQLTEQEVATYNGQLANGRSTAAGDSARLATAERQLREGGAAGPGIVGDATSSPIVSSLRTQRASIAANLASLEAHYGPNYPDVVRLRGQLADLDSSIAKETQSLIQELRARAIVSQDQLGAIASANSGARSTLASNNQAMIGFQALQLKAQSSQSLYDSYLSRYKELMAQEGTEMSQARVVSYADLPKWPSVPNLIIMPLLGFALAVGAAFASALIAELLFAGLTTGNDVEQRLGIRFLGSIPTTSGWARRGWRFHRAPAPAEKVVEEPGSAFAESFRHLLTTINFIAEGRKQVVMMTSALPLEGKTTAAFCLARSVALRGARVLLIDCDLRHPSLIKYAPGPGHPGLIEVLRSEATLDEALITDTQTGARMLAINAGNVHHSDILSAEPMVNLLADARERFDFIILDTAPILPVTETRILATYADAVVVLIRWRKTADHAVRTALRMLPAGRAYVAGAVLSRMDMRKQARFGYGDAYAYFKHYKAYYS